MSSSTYRQKTWSRFFGTDCTCLKNIFNATVAAIAPECCNIHVDTIHSTKQNR